MKSITITMRDTGRFYIGLSAEDFAALQEAVKSNPFRTAQTERLIKSFDDFNAKIRAEIAAAHNSLPTPS